MPQIIHTDYGNYLLSDPKQGNLSSEQDILDLFGFLR